MKFDHRFSLIEAAPGHRIYGADGVTMRLDFLPHMLRVALIHEGVPLVSTWSVCPAGADVPLAGRDKLSLDGFAPLAPAVTEGDGALSFALDGVYFSIELKNFRISAQTKNGLLYRDRSGLGYNFAGELGTGSVHYVDRFEGEQIFGLGDKCGPVNKAGQRFLLHTGDAMGFRAESSDPLYKHLPFYICRHSGGSYGLFYDTMSSGAVDLGREHDNYFEPFRSVRFEEENLVFYLILGTPWEIVQRFSALTGTAAPVPRWAFSYCGSTMAYTDAPDADRQLRGFVQQCEENAIPCKGFYLSSGYTQIGDRRCVFHWNREKIPSPEGLSAFFRAHGMALVPNVKPAFLTDHPLYDTIAQNGWFLKLPDGSPAQFPFWGGHGQLSRFHGPRGLRLLEAVRPGAAGGQGVPGYLERQQRIRRVGRRRGGRRFRPPPARQPHPAPVLLPHGQGQPGSLRGGGGGDALQRVPVRHGGDAAGGFHLDRGQPDGL